MFNNSICHCACSRLSTCINSTSSSFAVPDSLIYCTGSVNWVKGVEYDFQGEVVADLLFVRLGGVNADGIVDVFDFAG